MTSEFQQQPFFEILFSWLILSLVCNSFNIFLNSVWKFVFPDDYLDCNHLQQFIVGVVHSELSMSWRRLKHQRFSMKISTDIRKCTITLKKKTIIFYVQEFKRKTNSRKCPKNEAVMVEPPLSKNNSTISRLRKASHSCIQHKIMTIHKSITNYW